MSRIYTPSLPDPGAGLDSLGFAILCGAFTFFAGMVVGTSLTLLAVY